MSLDYLYYSLSIRWGEDTNPAICITEYIHQLFQRVISKRIRSICPCFTEARECYDCSKDVTIFEREVHCRKYDESFRILMRSKGWAWDCIHFELWLCTVQLLSFRVITQSEPLAGLLETVKTETLEP